MQLINGKPQGEVLEVVVNCPYCKTLIPPRLLPGIQFIEMVYPKLCVCPSCKKWVLVEGDSVNCPVASKLNREEIILTVSRVKK